jgi:translocation and assembly module TamA
MRRLVARALKVCLCASILLALPSHAAVRVEIEGIRGVLEENVRAHIGSPPAENGAALTAFQRRAGREAERALQALGYYNAQIRVSREPRGDDMVVRVQVEPGPQVRIAAVDVRLLGEAEDDLAFQQLLQRLPLRVGGGLHHGEYESAKRLLQSLALRRGYFDSRFQAQRVEVDAVDNVARVTLHLDSGPRYSMGAVSFSETPFTDDLLNRMVPFEEGDPYEADLIAQFNRTLIDSRYFSEVRVLPRHEERVGPVVPVSVELSERDPNLVGIGIGASTDTGPRVRLGWERHWVNRYGHKFSSELEVAEVRQGLTTRYTLPLEDPVNDTLDFQFGFRVEDVLDSERYTAAVQRQQYLGGGWRRTLFYRWERERFDQLDDDPRRLMQNSQLFIPGIGWSRTRTQGGIDPHWGDRQVYNLEGTHPLLGSDIGFTRTRVSGRLLRPIAGSHRLLLRGDAGILATEDMLLAPPSLRFYAGGDQSIRGFAYQSLGPGRYMAVGSVEYGYQFRQNWRLATFVDGGRVAAGKVLRVPSPAPDVPDEEGPEVGVEDAVVVEVDTGFKVGAGFGLHWISPVGPVRIDFAWGVSEDPAPFRLHFSLGAQL